MNIISHLGMIKSTRDPACAAQANACHLGKAVEHEGFSVVGRGVSWNHRSQGTTARYPYIYKVTGFLEESVYMETMPKHFPEALGNPGGAGPRSVPAGGPVHVRAAGLPEIQL